MNKCVFCQELVPVEEIQTRLQLARSLTHTCQCETEYFFTYPDNSYYKYIIYTNHKGFKYEAAFYTDVRINDYCHKVCYIGKWTGSHLGPVMWFDYHLPITPYNFHTKLPTILVFS
jgi:hypothetical protein